MVYLDYAATTPYNKDVLKTYTQLLEKYFYNADSIYSQGIEVNRLLEKSRGLLAKMLDVDEEEMIFTSCGSEANNMAIKGIAFQYQNRGKHIITTSIEHSSVYETCKDTLINKCLFAEQNIHRYDHSDYCMEQFHNQCI